MKTFGLLDVCLLTALGTSTKQHDQYFAVLGQVDPVPRAPIDDRIIISI